jgi:2-amino-4-hydroxy-6-hydroxymethyldihydropteridine diphosphokinase
VNAGGAIWRPAYVGIGSNLQTPSRQVETAFELLGDIPDTRLIAHSHLYRSAPFGGVEQADFVNAVAALLTRLDAHAFFSELQAIEFARGREPGGVRWGPRVLDLDLLVYSDEIIEDSDLIVPHAGIGERNFVLLPLRELAPELMIPGLGRVKSISVNNDEPRITRIE